MVTIIKQYPQNLDPDSFFTHSKCGYVHNHKNDQLIHLMYSQVTMATCVCEPVYSVSQKFRNNKFMYLRVNYLQSRYQWYPVPQLPGSNTGGRFILWKHEE